MLVGRSKGRGINHKWLAGLVWRGLFRSGFGHVQGLVDEEGLIKSDLKVNCWDLMVRKGVKPIKWFESSSGALSVGMSKGDYPGGLVLLQRAS